MRSISASRLWLSLLVVGLTTFAASSVFSGFCATHLQTAVAAGHPHRILFHVAANDTGAMSHAISAADNAMKFYRDRGETVAIEIVANGAGVRMMRADTSPVAASVAYLHQTYPSIVLSACGTTLRLMKEHDGVEPTLLEGVSVTPSGIARIIELEEAGWSYVRS